MEGEEDERCPLRMMFWNVCGWPRNGINGKEKSVGLSSSRGVDVYERLGCLEEQVEMLADLGTVVVCGKFHRQVWLLDGCCWG